MSTAQINAIMPPSRRDVFLPGIRRSKSCGQFDFENLPDKILSDKNCQDSSRKISVNKSKIVHGQVELKQCADQETQTLEASSLDPYEKLVEGFISSAKLPSNASSANVEHSPHSPHQLLDAYIRNNVLNVSTSHSVLPDERATPQKSANSPQKDLPEEELKSQLHSLFCLMLLERQKREFHAKRNCSLLIATKRMFVTLEQQKGLLSQVILYLKKLLLYLCNFVFCV